MTKRTTALIVAVLLAIGVLATAAVAQGPGKAQGPPDHAGPPSPDVAGVTVLQGENTGHVDASGSYAAAAVVDTVHLTEGDWKVTATGAVSLTGDAVALNCGLRIGDEETGFTMIGKQNPATGGETGRVGFAVTGGIIIEEGEVAVDLVCYGGGDLPFEHNLVAVGG
jgi:hypothetical protein